VVVTVSTNASSGDVATISEESASVSELTPRSRESLERLARDGNIVIVRVDDELAGWGVREPLGRGVFELGMTYVRPTFRATDAFRRLAAEMVSATDEYLVATYKPELVDFLVREHGFRRSGLVEFVWRSRGSFITKRLDRASCTAVRDHASTGRALYVIRDAR
jgi:hypothetical protein